MLVGGALPLLEDLVDPPHAGWLVESRYTEVAEVGLGDAALHRRCPALGLDPTRLGGGIILSEQTAGSLTLRDGIPQLWIQRPGLGVCSGTTRDVADTRPVEHVGEPGRHLLGSLQRLHVPPRRQPRIPPGTPASLPSGTPSGTCGCGGGGDLAR